MANDKNSLGGGDKLAKGGIGVPAQFPSSSHLTEIKWDYGFLSDPEFFDKHGVTKEQYEQIVK